MHYRHFTASSISWYTVDDCELPLVRSFTTDLLCLIALFQNLLEGSNMGVTRMLARQSALRCVGSSLKQWWMSTSAPFHRQHATNTQNKKPKLIDLSRELYHRSPAHPLHPPVCIGKSPPNSTLPFHKHRLIPVQPNGTPTSPNAPAIRPSAAPPTPSP